MYFYTSSYNRSSLENLELSYHSSGGIRMKVLGPATFVLEVFLTLTVFCAVVYSQSLDSQDGFEEVIMRTRANCNATTIVDPRSPGYTLISQLGRYRCSPSERGFKCQTTFHVQDPFDLLGFRLCADLQGVDESFRSQCQLKVEVTSPESADVLKAVYCTSHLHSPDYTCVTGRTLILTYGTRPTVRVCPSILEYLFKNKFPVGSVMLRQETPVYNVYLGSCVQNQVPDESEFIIKVYSPEYNPSQCPRNDRSVITSAESKMTGCLSLLYMSDSYFCPIDVVLVTSRSRKELTLKVLAHLRNLPQGSQATICKDFDLQEDGDLMLNISAHSQAACSGKFAVRVSVRNLKDNNPNDSSQFNSPRVFMAVFIALIIICLVCLALTCLCCIRFRTKRLRNARRRRRQGTPTTNEGFDGPVEPAIPYDGSISWSQSDPGIIFGLPSYEDVTGERPAGVNPVSDRAHKDDLPPSYDSIFAQETSGN